MIDKLCSVFSNATVVDRRESPSHGYRAVHVIVTIDEKLIELQVRTTLQHLWAELSEKLSDKVDPAIKYGGGDEATRLLLTEASADVAKVEATEDELHSLSLQQDLSARKKLQAAKVSQSLVKFKQGFAQLLKKLIDHVAD